MPIQFQCPNGHPITCADDRAGKPAKCPKCKTRFQVPAEGKEGDNVVAQEISEPTTEPESEEEVIEFLCPNGHKLSGPASLQGHPGQCPHCGSKFQIPSAEDFEEDEGDEEHEQEDHEHEDAAPSNLGLETITPVDDFNAGAEQAWDVEDAVMVLPEAGTPAVAHPMSAMFLTLWEHRKDGIVEIRCKDGGVLTPTDYSYDASSDAVALFAISDDQGEQVLAVAWDHVARVELRGIKRLPSGMFE
jgi:hypothetical protein